MKKIFIYVGRGAYQARDIENFLAVFEYDYERINEFELDQLTPDDILLIPGGEIHAFLPAMDEKGIKEIRRFVSDGGTYIGICAGACIAGSKYDDVLGLNFFPQILEAKEQQATIDVTDEAGDKYQLINENGPDLSDIRPDRILLKDDNNNPQGIMLNHGSGKVYLFSSHPEGGIYYRLLPQDFPGAKYFKGFIDKLISE